MKLAFLYQPVTDLAAAADFCRQQLGWSEAWREGSDTIAFALPDSPAQLMICTDPLPAGPMFLVDDVDAWIDAHPGLDWPVPKYAIPGGSVAGFAGPDGATMYVFDQPDA